MRTSTRFMLCVAALLLVVAQPGFAQNVTNGTLSGVVTDAQKGVLPGATVTAVHVPTGTTYEAITQADGHFTMLAVRVGGPYTVKATMTGFKTQEQAGIMVQLGESKQRGVHAPARVGHRDGHRHRQLAADRHLARGHGGQRVGTGARDAADHQPQHQRLRPHLAVLRHRFGRRGQRGRHHVSPGATTATTTCRSTAPSTTTSSVSPSTGTPGGQTGTQPVSLDAIQEIQLVVSPYDVRQGGFSGGGINAVTKSGTNALHGTRLLLRPQPELHRHHPRRRHAEQSESGRHQGRRVHRQADAASASAARSCKNKAFFFTNFDWGRKNTPSGFSADGILGQQFGQQAYVQRSSTWRRPSTATIRAASSEFSKPNNSNKVFARTDFNLTSSNQLTVARELRRRAMADIGTQTSSNYKMPDNFYNMTDKMLSSVVQLNSSLGPAFNEFRVTYQRERNVRGGQPGQPTFPEVRVDLPGRQLGHARHRVLVAGEQAEPGHRASSPTT